MASLGYFFNYVLIGDSKNQKRLVFRRQYISINEYDYDNRSREHGIKSLKERIFHDKI